MVNFNHEFIGKDALEKMKPRRKKVTLAWNHEDATAAIGTMFGTKGKDRVKYIDFPSAVYSTLPYDKVLSGGKTIGVSTWSGYSSNERSMLSLAIVDEAFAEPGKDITLVWGEEGGGSRKPTVERHTQMNVRVTVGPVPYAAVAREAYRPQSGSIAR
jgi:syringate O-demethylase